MAKKKFKVDIFSRSSIEKLKQDLIAYQGELQAKTWLLCQRLAEQGLNVAQAKVNESPLGKYVTLKIDMDKETAGTKAILIATGEVKQSEGYPPFYTLLAIEFGAGIYYNKEINPNANEFNLGPGTFPGQLHAMEDGWYFWDEKTQKWRYTHGVQATMPMYHASIEIIQDIVKTAKEIFS